MNEFLQIQLLGIFSLGMNLGWALVMIPLLPLLGFLLLGLFGKKFLKQSAGIFATLLLTASAFLSLHTAY